MADGPLSEYMRIYYSDTLGVAPAPDFLSLDQVLKNVFSHFDRVCSLAATECVLLL